MIYVIGANGQIGHELKKTPLATKAIFLERSQLDIANHKDLEFFLKSNKITSLINAAAFTNVDLAESDKIQARSINSEAVRIISEFSHKKKFKFVHYSTDYVFDGASSTPYTESDKTSPLNYYGITKKEGEAYIKTYCPSAIILRTSWVYGTHGKNFLNTIKKIAKERESLNVVFDQIGTPTSAKDLAKITNECLEQGLEGLYHYSNEGCGSWYDFAHEIINQLNLKTTVLPIHSSEFPTVAQRPNFSLLDKTQIKKELNKEIPHWKDSLAEILKL